MILTFNSSLFLPCVLHYHLVTISLPIQYHSIVSPLDTRCFLLINATFMLKTCICHEILLILQAFL